MHDKIIFKETFSQLRASEGTLSEVMKMTIDNKKTYRSTGKRVLIAAAVVALTLALSVTALAATGVIDFGRFYDSIFSNPEASPYVIAGDNEGTGNPFVDGSGTEAGGFEVLGSGIDVNGSGALTVEPVAVLFDGEWNVYIQLKLTAPEKLLLPEELYIMHKFTNEYGSHEACLNSFGMTDITYIDEKSAIVSFRTQRQNCYLDVEAGTITFKIDAFSPVSDVFVKFDGDGAPHPVADEYPTMDDTIYYGSWELVIYDDNSKVETLWVDGSFDGYDAKVRIGATTINVRAESDSPVGAGGWKWVDGGVIRVTLADGRTVESPYVENMTDSTCAEYWGTIEFVNPADVVKVELFGETVWSID